MILLDTNVLSELMRAKPDANVMNWLESQSAASLFTTTISEAEIFYGLALLPDGKRRKALELAAAGLFDDFRDRALPFDSGAARAYAKLAAARRLAGKPMSQSDAQIAAIARAHGARLATRNQDDFTGSDVELLDPWA